MIVSYGAGVWSLVWTMGIIRYTVRWDEQKRKWCVRGKIDNKYGYEVERCFDYEWQANEELEKLLKNNKAN